MQTKKVYSLDTINVLKAEINKVKDKKKKELTLDKILLQARKEITELIELKCDAREIAQVFNNSGIKVGVNKIKQLYFKPLSKNKVKQVNKFNQLVKEQ